MHGDINTCLLSVIRSYYDTILLSLVMDFPLHIHSFSKVENRDHLKSREKHNNIILLFTFQ